MGSETLPSLCYILCDESSTLQVTGIKIVYNGVEENTIKNSKAIIISLLFSH